MVQETKQVRVDNWGTYFLQRLQLFFSKTDYCDLTLQFDGNVQLKVHRLVMNACTEYFLFLEQTCPALEENTILMPDNLQADVIVPIVNFMYTGMLEFHPSIFQKLYKAAEIMSITVLTKLLEAQMESIQKGYKTLTGVKKKLGGRGVKQDLSNFDHSKQTRFEDEAVPSYSRSPVVPKRKPIVSPPKSSPLPPAPVEDIPSPVASVAVNRPRVNWRRRQMSNSNAAGTHPSSGTFSEVKWQPVTNKDDKTVTVLHDSTPRPTRFEWPEDDLPSSSFMDTSFDENISLTSRPLVTKREEDQRAGPSTYSDSKSSYSRSESSRPNSYSAEHEESIREQQKGNCAQEDRDEKPNIAEQSGQKRKFESVVKMVSPKRAKRSEKENEEHITSEHTISIKTPKSSGELDHTKLVQEILKKYPGLVKKNKNIKLKIMTKPDTTGGLVNHKIKMQISSSPERPVENEKPNSRVVVFEPSDEPEDPLAITKTKLTKTKTKRTGPDGPWTCLGCDDSPEFVLYYLFRKHMSDVHNEKFDNSSCKYCDRKCSSEVTMAYHLHVKHNLKPPAKMNFPKCPKCAFIGITSEKLKLHVAKHNPENVQCPHCKLGFENRLFLSSHLIFASHNNSRDTKLDCPYCMRKKNSLSPAGLFNHIKECHLKDAQRDRILSLDDNMDFEDPEEEVFEGEEPEEDEVEDVLQQRDKVKIISDVQVARKATKEEIIEEEQEEGEETHENSETTEPETIDPNALSNIDVPRTIANDLGLVDIVVLDDNRQYILQQAPQRHQEEEGTEFILPQDLNDDALLQAASNELNSTDELVMVLTDQDYHQDGQSPGQSDNSNIVVLYSHPVEGQEGQFITSQGNIMVNSQTGLLEIRNGAAITTTDGDILVNQEVSTENQAESIELIEKEIQQNPNLKENPVVNTVVKNRSASKLTKLNQSNSGFAKDQNASQLTELNQQNSGFVSSKAPQKFKELVVNNEENTLEVIKEVSEDGLNNKKSTDEDVPDGLSQGEPMEVDEDAALQPIQEASNGDVVPEPQDKQLEPAEDNVIDKDTLDNHGSDIPPELNTSKDESVIDDLNTSAEENLILNDTTGFCSDNTVAPEEEPCLQSTEDQTIQQNQQESAECQEEAMEVDGDLKSQKILDEEISNQETHKETEAQLETSTDLLPQSDPIAENAIVAAEQEDSPLINQQEKGECKGDKEEGSKSPRRMMDRNDVQSEINKSILEDWSEDTDSQQSEKQDISTESTDNTDIGADMGAEKQTSNVSKLMDDWEEEDEGN